MLLDGLAHGCCARVKDTRFWAVLWKLVADLTGNDLNFYRGEFYHSGIGPFLIY